MIRLLLILFLVLNTANAKESIDKKITKTSTKLKSTKKSQTSINKKMAKNAKAILKQKKDIRKQNKYLKKLTREIKAKEKSHAGNILELKELMKSQEKLRGIQDAIEEELVFTIAQGVSLTVVLEEDVSSNADALIETEVLEAMLKASKKKANTLNKDFFANSKIINILKDQTSSLEITIANMDLKKSELKRTQKSNKVALKKLEKAKKLYKAEIKTVIKKQNSLKKTLSKLNIIKIDKIKKAKIAKERKLAFEREKKESAKKRDPIVLEKNLPKVKKHGSSYEAAKTKKYKGPKTIAPLDSYTIIKKYGTYTDPVYGIKIFNESISLKPRSNNAKVKTVFNGKVIYADKTAVLDNIVIVQHKNGLHTIYANLSQIPSNIKKGKKVKKGTTIGRVKDELIFEVTQKSFHINPIRLFK